MVLANGIKRTMKTKQTMDTVTQRTKVDETIRSTRHCHSDSVSDLTHCHECAWQNNYSCHGNGK